MSVEIHGTLTVERRGIRPFSCGGIGTGSENGVDEPASVVRAVIFYSGVI